MPEKITLKSYEKKLVKPVNFEGKPGKGARRDSCEGGT